MSKIQETLDELQPYVIGIRYVEGVPVVDVVFKEGWTVPDELNIKKVKGKEQINYYMLFSEVKGIGLDELLKFVEKTINLNIEREHKYELLTVKINELKEIFKHNSLEKLKTLNFSFDIDNLMPSIDMFELTNEASTLDEPIEVLEAPTEVMIENVVETPLDSFLDKDGKVIEMTEEEIEIAAEEARAEKNRLYLESKKLKKETKKLSTKVELPIKTNIEIPVTHNDNDYESDSECGCGPNDACNKCIDTKY